MNKSLLIIFAKNPELGKVKTRLAATVGNEVALAVYFQLLNKTKQETAAVSADKVVYYSNYVEEGDLWDDAIYTKSAQQGDDLGQRMQNAFEQAFAKGYERVCIIGSDLMDLSTEVIEQAFEKLNQRDVVVGPSEDGGYYLLGMNQMIPDLFKNKAWSTDEVFIATRDDARRLGLSMAELPVLNDIDTEKDLGDWASIMTPKYLVN